MRSRFDAGHKPCQGIPHRCKTSLSVTLALIVTSLAAQEQSVANLWVDVNGGNCTRSATRVAYNDAAACGSFGAAYAAASGGDTIRIRPGTYGSQASGVGGSKTPVITFIGDGASSTVVVDSGNGVNQGLHLRGNVTVDNVDVAGDYPTVIVVSGSSNNTWQNSRLQGGRLNRGCHGEVEPILVYGDPTIVTNTTFRDLVIETQRGSLNGTNGCVGDLYHLEQVRIDGDVNGLLIDRVTFEACPNGATYSGCGSGQVFITTAGGKSTWPRNITIRNSVFKGGPNYWIQTHFNVKVCQNWTIAYNTFRNGALYCPGAERSNFQIIGNIGTEPQSCQANTTYIRNVWQWSIGTPCGTDTRVAGTNFQIDKLGLDSNLRPTVTSPVIDAAEGAYCTGGLGSVDRDGNARPVSNLCDAGAFEFGSITGQGPGAPTNLRILIP